MAKPLIDIATLDHPEHYDDLIREFQSIDRYTPFALATHLYQVAGHRCTLCQAPWLEIHHIDFLSATGKTEYENLIVLCPNCHTRVHQENIPTPNELRQYKLKQDVAYGLPVVGKFGANDKAAVRYFVDTPDADLVVREIVSFFDTPGETQEVARTAARRANALYLQECGIIDFQITGVGVGMAMNHRVNFRMRLTPKGINWIRYVRTSDLVTLVTP